jgi:hypothetical protein
VSSRRTPASLSDTASSRATTPRSATCESLNLIACFDLCVWALGFLDWET